MLSTYTKHVFHLVINVCFRIVISMEENYFMSLSRIPAATSNLTQHDFRNLFVCSLYDLFNSISVMQADNFLAIMKELVLDSFIPIQTTKASPENRTHAGEVTGLDISSKYSITEAVYVEQKTLKERSDIVLQTCLLWLNSSERYSPVHRPNVSLPFTFLTLLKYCIQVDISIFRHVSVQPTSYNEYSLTQFLTTQNVNKQLHTHCPLPVFKVYCVFKNNYITINQ